MAKRKGLPKEFLIYQGDEDSGAPLYFIAENINQINAEDYDGVLVGVYTLTHTSKFRVKRELK